ncbi:MAG: GTPase ObgE [Chitinispirillaceae bacterium]|nr:GTPase ObgE [Chitinispirillaceae bacterium]
MFIDETVIQVEAGDGGNGCHAYERLKFKSKGRPDGGDGGNGGNIYFEGSPQVHTLQDVAYHQRYKAERGAHGKGSNKTGRNGENVIIKVPLGTIVRDEETKDIVIDCLRDGASELIARGGRGGRGNATLVSPKNPNPEFCEPGKPGEKKKLRLVLKVLADVGLVGRPNAGKSTFISAVSKARPKIADYPFTTKEPHLGIVNVPRGYNSFVMADIPGLIEDCHLGKGLGIRFLRHIERTKILAILVDASSEDIEAEAGVLLHELNEYSQNLAAKPKVFIATKADLLTPDSPAIADHWMKISSVTGDGVDAIVRKLAEMVKEEKLKDSEIS